jgi:putative tryptophan/tyrosine transport system substrate-binding protein
VRRRKFLRLLGGTAAWWPLSARPQERGKVGRIGFLRVGSPPAAFIDGFRQGLSDLGFFEGQHFIIEYALTQSAAQMPEAAGELAARGVDVIVASGTPSVVPARNAAGRIPVVFIATLDPVATGLVASLARPARNISGMTSVSGDVIAKRLGMTRELLPNLNRIAVLVRESSPTAAQYVRESQVAARELGIELQIESARDAQGIDRTFAAVRGASVLVVADDAEFTANRTQIAEFALRYQLPTVSGLREMVEAGGLMAYGASFGELYRRAASHVHKILRGANVADLPVEQPTKFELVLNIRTAKVLGLTIPLTLLARADEVIE